jgi:hypothetical protein
LGQPGDLPRGFGAVAGVPKRAKSGAIESLEFRLSPIGKSVLSKSQAAF